MRVKAVIAYDGSHFFGFQKQKSTPNTVAGELESALHSVHISSEIMGSGRTDAGVHATGQVIHFDLPPYWDDVNKLKLTLNRKLKHIVIKHITQVNETFHARFSAKKRMYRYVFKTQKPSVFEETYISYYSYFDEKKLQNALDLFIGIHDFKYFKKTGSPTHTDVREIYTAKYLYRKGFHLIYFQANGFLRSQVRMMVEMCMQYAQGRVTLEQVSEQIKTQKKHNQRLAPPEGLYLAQISY
jgi:tRNA pseudouridine38-40 synthase